MENDLNRRKILQLGGTWLALSTNPRMTASQVPPGRKKSVIVIGAGIAGLSCAYELVRRGHEVTVLEARGRAGGHVRTFHDPFADSLYADIGAEHFYYPGYTLYWQYLQEFGLQAIPYGRRRNLVRFMDGQRYTEENLHTRAVLTRMGFNPRETDFLTEHSWAELPLLYFEKYVDQIDNETDPFVNGLDRLDQVTIADLLRSERASPAAIKFFGSSAPALQMIWGAAMKKLRGTDLETKKLFRIKGGNQLLTDAFAARLGNKIHLGCPVKSVRHDTSGVSVAYTESSEDRELSADHLVSAISLVMLRQLPVTPAWPSAKAFVIQGMPYYTRTRIVFQCRTRFWQSDGVSPNWLTPDPRLSEVWSMAEEVDTARGILIGGAQAGITEPEAFHTFLKLYPGKSAEIEQVLIHDWSKEPWAGMCERIPYKLGELARFWPEVTKPCGRIHFAGAYAAQMNWGQEAALESAHRAAEEIHGA